MSRYITPSQLYEVQFICRSENQIAINNRFFVSAATFANSAYTEEQALDELNAVYSPLYADLLCETAFFYGTRIRPLIVPQILDWETQMVDLQGSVLGDPLPKQICGILSFNAGFIDRHYKGRNYIPFPAEANNASTSRPDTVYTNNLQTLANRSVGTITVDPLGIDPDAILYPHVYSRTLNLSQPLTVARRRERWGTQRRRGDFGQSNALPF